MRIEAGGGNFTGFRYGSLSDADRWTMDEEQPALRSRLLSGLGWGTAAGVLVCLALVFHDGRTWPEGLAVGAGFFAGGFLLGFSRTLRRIAELLSLIR